MVAAGLIHKHGVAVVHSPASSMRATGRRLRFVPNDAAASAIRRVVTGVGRANRAPNR